MMIIIIIIALFLAFKVHELRERNVRRLFAFLSGRRWVELREWVLEGAPVRVRLRTWAPFDNPNPLHITLK